PPHLLDTGRGRDRPGRGDMSERTPGLSAEAIDRHLAQSPWCIWPGCEYQKIRDSMICHYHVAECAELVFNLRKLPKVTVDARDVEQGAFAAWFRKRHPVDSDESPRARDGYIYILRTDDLVKIGYTTRPYDRLRQYP